MGEWSEAMEDGIICPRCFSLTLGEEGNQVICTCPASPPLRPEVQRQQERPMPLGPNWLPPIRR